MLYAECNAAGKCKVDANKNAMREAKQNARAGRARKASGACKAWSLVETIKTRKQEFKSCESCGQKL